MVPSGQGRRVGELLETINVFSGWLLPVLGSGSLYKATLDTVFRYHNNAYYLGDNADPLATDVYGNQYGRYHFSTNNFGISGNPLAHFRLEQTEVNISKSGSQTPSPFNGETLYSGETMPAALILENLAAVDNSYVIFGSKGTGHNMGAHIDFIQTGEDEDAFGIGFFTRTPLANNTRQSSYLSDLGYMDIGSGRNGGAAIRIMGTGGHEQTTFRIQNNNNANFRIKAQDDTSSTNWMFSGGSNQSMSFELGGNEVFKLLGTNKHIGFNTNTVDVSGYQFNGEMLVTGNLLVENSGITIAPNWIRPQANLHISGSGFAGAGDGIKIQSTQDAFLRLEADINDNPEGDNAYILMTQDGGLTSGFFGLCSGANTGPLGIVSGVNANSLIMQNKVAAGVNGVGGLHLATQNKVWATLTTGGFMGVGGITTPSGTFHISGSGVFIDYDNLNAGNPNIKGQIYRDGSNALYVSAG